jgi:GDP-L-fucose synthase
MLMKKLLLTGSGGFIGQNLKRGLQDEYTLLTPRSAELDLRDAATVKDFFAANDIDFIVHCGSTGGARGIQDVDTTIEDNLAMVDNLLSVKRADARMILFGSGAMYGKSRSLHKVKEDEIGSFIPEDLYGKSKMMIAQKIKDRADIVCLNIFACYGYGEKESRFPSYAINQAIKGEDIVINKNVVFDYLWVDDLIRIVRHFIENQPHQNIINVTPTNGCELREIAEIVREISRKDIAIVCDDELGNEYTGDNARLLQEFPELTFTPLREGLEKLFSFLNGAEK